MSELLFHYEKVNPTTWFYLSSLMMIGLYFKFSRIWSVRNLDLLLLILLAPGLILAFLGQRAAELNQREWHKREEIREKLAPQASDKPGGSDLDRGATTNPDSTDPDNPDPESAPPATNSTPSKPTPATPAPPTSTSATPTSPSAITTPTASPPSTAPVATSAAVASATPSSNPPSSAILPSSATPPSSSDPRSSAPESPSAAGTDGAADSQASKLVGSAYSVLSLFAKDERDLPQLEADWRESRRVASIGFIWLVLAGGVWLTRLLLDPTMARRPLLEPNLSTGGMIFLAVSLFVFLMANVITSEPTVDDLRGPRAADALLSRKSLAPNGDDLSLHGPGYAFLTLLPSLPTMSISPTSPDGSRQDAHAVVA